MKTMRLNEKGFTLVESVIAVGVVAIILTIISIFAINSLQQSSVESARATLAGESQLTMDKIIRDVRLSAGADLNNRWQDANKSGGPLTWESNAGTLVLATAVVNSGNNIIFADPLMYISEKNNIIYFVNNGKLYRRVLASSVSGNNAKTTCPSSVATTACPADAALLRNVTGFNIVYYNGDQQQVTPPNARSVEITISTSTRKFSQNVNSNYTTRAVFRND